MDKLSKLYNRFYSSLSQFNATRNLLENHWKTALISVVTKEVLGSGLQFSFPLAPEDVHQSP